MEFPTYTYKGLQTKLHSELNKSNIDKELISRITTELKNRPLLTLPQMSAKEQIHWILEDIDFDLIKKYYEAFSNRYHNRIIDITSIERLKETASDLLNEISTWEENDYGHSDYRRGHFHARREIIDGVMCLSLDFVITSWDMDYDCVTSSKYSDEKYEGPIND